ncbi:hypothetical protein C0J52_10777 [Blattella germanica]|nr:hypothetical protein C0J52_10777 [Blattella germanica]
MPSHQRTEYHFNQLNGDQETKTFDHRTEDNEAQTVWKKPSVFRTKISQYVANLSCHLLALDLCMAFAFTTIVNAALMDSTGKDDLTLNSVQASWLGSIAYICQPAGSVMSGFIVEFFGRKWSMIIVNLPFLIGWILYSVSHSVAMLYTTNVILGVGIGFMEAPILTYVAETCQPELRAILTALLGITAQISFFVDYLLGTVTTWRTAAAISTALPIITALYVTQMPESPIWLLSRGREKEAERSLCWLRGWVTPDVVKQEFNELVLYNSKTNTTGAIQLNTIESSQVILDQAYTIEYRQKYDITHLRGMDAQEYGEESHCSVDLWKEMIRPPTLRPLLLVIPFFFLYQLGGMAAIRPYMVHVFREFGLHDVAEWVAVGSAVIGIIGAAALVGTVNWLGKRLISLISFMGNAVACVLLAVYILLVLRPGSEGNSMAWIPLTLIVIFSFFSSVLFEVPWTMLSEIFPFRTRGIASGLSAAMCYIFLFIATKTYLDLEKSLELYGVFLLFGAINLVGFIFVYFRMPVMEGRTLIEIEEYFSGQTKGFVKNVPRK